MPLMVATLREAGTAPMIARRTPARARTMKSSPSTKTAARATRQETPMPMTTP